MARTNPSKTVTLASSMQDCPCHVCAFFSGKEEEYRVMLPFMAEGFEAGDKLLHILDKDERSARLARLRGAGIDVESAQRSGQLELRPWEQAHTIGGRFDMVAMLELHQRHLAADTRPGRTTRMWSNQEWFLEQGLPSADDLLEYEARFNYIWPKFNNVYVCVYDAQRFSAGIMMQMLRTHPFVIIDGVMHENSFYVPPDQLLSEIGREHSRVK
jgi:hypothetical protein